MSSEFVFCPACGTRNFAEDKVCGVCKKKLHSDQVSSAPKNNYLVVGLIVAFALFIFYNLRNSDGRNDEIKQTSSSYSVAQKSDVKDYSLIKIEDNSPVKFSADIRIYKKLSNTELRNIAIAEKKDMEVKANRGSIAFFLPEMDPGTGAWAAVDFLPGPSVRIIGQSISAEQEISAGLQNIKDFEGLWVDNFTQGAIIQRIRKDKIHGYVIEFISPSNPKPSDLATPLKKIIKDGKVIYKDLENRNQYFEVEENGNLSAFDKDGYISTYQKVK